MPEKQTDYISFQEEIQQLINSVEAAKSSIPHNVKIYLKVPKNFSSFTAAVEVNFHSHGIQQKKYMEKVGEKFRESWEDILEDTPIKANVSVDYEKKTATFFIKRDFLYFKIRPAAHLEEISIIKAVFENLPYFLAEIIENASSYAMNNSIKNGVHGVFEKNILEIQKQFKIGSRCHDEGPVYLSRVDVDELKDNVPILSKHKFMKFLGCGANGIAFQIENSHVVKIFCGASSQPSLKKYKNIYDRQFNGIYLEGDPAIYDFGFDPSTQVGWVEMGYVTTILDMVEKNKGQSLDSLEDIPYDKLTTIYNFLLYLEKYAENVAILNYYPQNKESGRNNINLSKENLKDSIELIVSYRILSEEQIKSILRAVFNYFDEHEGHPSIDLNWGNIGFLDNGTAILFDT